MGVGGGAGGREVEVEGRWLEVGFEGDVEMEVEGEGEEL